MEWVTADGHAESGERKRMTRTSRDKLNAAHMVGSIGVAALFAALADSWPLFVVIAASLVGASVVTGEIRLQRRGR